MRERGLEPLRPFGHQTLNLACLPFHHSRKSMGFVVGLNQNPMVRQRQSEKALSYYSCGRHA